MTEADRIIEQLKGGVLALSDSTDDMGLVEIMIEDEKPEHLTIKIHKSKEAMDFRLGSGMAKFILNLIAMATGEANAVFAICEHCDSGTEH